MARNIYIVDAHIVDANGTFNYLSNYPKTFDSKNYDGDVDKAKRRAEGDFSEVYGAFCKRDDRQMQTVVLMSVDGFVLDSKAIGAIADVTPTPEPEE